jgi:hypothetical protein
MLLFIKLLHFIKILKGKMEGENMRIIDRGNLKDLWKCEIKCIGDKNSGCGAKLEISEKDLKKFHWLGTNLQHFYLSVRCPICGIIIQKVTVPKYVVDRWNKNHPKTKSTFDGHDET